MFCRPPNHFTHTQSLGVGSPSGPLTIFPGQALQPRTAPHTRSPMQNVVGFGEDELEIDVVVIVDGEVINVEEVAGV